MVTTHENCTASSWKGLGARRDLIDTRGWWKLPLPSGMSKYHLVDAGEAQPSTVPCTKPPAHAQAKEAKYWARVFLGAVGEEDVGFVAGTAGGAGGSEREIRLMELEASMSTCVHGH